jgi:DNA repair and recombination protein RAD54B
MQRWNVIALDSNERKAKKTKLDGVLTIGPSTWAIDVTNAADELVHKSVPARDATALSSGAKIRLGPFEMELIDAAPAEAASAAPPSVSILAPPPTRAAPPPRSTPVAAAAARAPFRPAEQRAPAAVGRQPFKAPTGSGGVSKAAPHVIRASPAPALPPPPSSWCLDSAGMLSVDQALAAALRPHQKEGVQFMYDCLTGVRGPGGGCILADTMGLGKTIQALTLIVTMGRPRPTSPRGWTEPVGLTAVVCPASLVKSWEAEVGKWPKIKALIGDHRMHVVGPSTKSEGTSAKRLRDFLTGPRQLCKLLLISYEQFRRLAPTMSAAPIDLLICDEGHRLKASAGNQTIDALSSTRARFRVLLSATPVQNHLGELWAMANFVLPDGPLGALHAFRRRFAEPIEAARCAQAAGSVRALGAERGAELCALLAPFTLRRDASVLRSFLPPRHDWLLFAQLSAEQRGAYDAAAAGALADGAGALGAIAQLCAICSHPELAARAQRDDDDDDGGRLPMRNGGGAWADEDEEGGGGEGDDELAAATAAAEPAADACVLSERASDVQGGRAFVARSAKLALAEALLLAIVRGTDEKVVVVCKFLKTLALLQGVCVRAGIDALSLDGSTASSGRQLLVERFNCCDACRASAAFRASAQSSCAHTAAGPRVFLLTARAGGVGLTIVGASRMVVVEPDWNPAVDQQAMGRIYREGQRRPTHIYRLFAVSTIEEKILQRQLSKLEVANEVVASSGGAAAAAAAKARTGVFAHDDLRELFAPHRPLFGTAETLRLLAHAEGQGEAMPRVLSEAAAADPTLVAALGESAQDPRTGSLGAAAAAHVCGWDEVEQMMTRLRTEGEAAHAVWRAGQDDE